MSAIRLMEQRAHSALAHSSTLLYTCSACVPGSVCMCSAVRCVLPAKRRAAPSAMYNTGREGDCREDSTVTVNTVQ